MEGLEYTTKDKQKRIAVDTEAAIVTMEELERFNGTTKEKIVDNWYELKRRLITTLAAKEEKKE